MTKCIKCGGSWESDADSAIVHKTALCASCKKGDVPILTAPQPYLREAAAPLVREAGTKTEHAVEGVPVFFNPTAPPGMLLCVGPDDDPDHLELHGSEDAYRVTMADPRMAAGARRMVRMIRDSLRAKKTCRQARLN